jgi:prepilin peptidase CpaA
MSSQTIEIGLLAALSVVLLYAIYTDLKERTIDDWFNLGIALAAPLYWWASGLSLWPDMAIQLGFGLVIIAIFLGVFALGMMGGGDVKLLGALALWLPPMPFFGLLIVMSIIGGVLTIFFLIRHKLAKLAGQPEIPYGVAISLAGFWAIYERYLNHFA